MGHFSYTCSISGLAITGGTPVRCLLLTASPYTDDDPRKSWVVRTPPIRAEYNSYGTIENINKDDEFIANLWLRGLKEDLVEKGTGDNEYHDLPASKDMAFEQLLEALRSGDVQVHQDVHRFWRRPSDDSWMDKLEDKDLPMFKRIERLFQGIEAYRVNEPVPNLVRVRFGHHLRGPEHLEGLKRAQVIVENAGFASVICKGTGRYADEADLLVLNPPREGEHGGGAQWDMATGQRSADDKLLTVSLAMVREDVWQALVAYPRSKGVYLDCLNCGQEAYYHAKDRKCPSKMANKKPLKPHKRGSVYAHGPVFPSEVEHFVLTRDYGETVWYGFSAFKAGAHATWEKIRAYFDRNDRRMRGEEVEEPDQDPEDMTAHQRMDKFMREMEQERKKEAERVAALPEAERLELEAKQAEQTAKWKAHQQERLDHPVFGDYLINDSMLPRGDDLGSWMFHGELPGVIGIPEHLSMCLADRKEVPALVIDSMAELAAIRYAMSEVGVVWKPASSTGPQDPEWAEYVRFNETLVQISKKEARRREEKEPLPVTLGEAIKRFAPTRKKAVKPTKKKVKKKR